MPHPRSGGGGGGQATDVAIHAREIVRLKERLLDILVEATGRIGPS
jgi:ATP-dependent protease ClpP protease subunit